MSSGTRAFFGVEILPDSVFFSLARTFFSIVLVGGGILAECSYSLENE